MSSKMSKNEILWFGLLYGGIWGFLEATLGYVLNMIPMGISGGIMFPIAYMLMTRAYERSGSLEVISLMTVVTAAIKLSNLALPFLPVVKVVNPAFAILLEGFSIAVLFKYTIHKKREVSFLSVVLTCMSWRIIYLAEVTVLYFINIPSRMIQSGLYSILEYLMLGVINTLIIYIFVRVKNGINSESGESEKRLPAVLNPFLPAAAVTLGIVFQYLVKL